MRTLTINTALFALFCASTTYAAPNVEGELEGELKNKVDAEETSEVLANAANASDRCASLFGDQQMREDNLDAVKSVDLMGAAPNITLMHSGPWQGHPTRLSVEGLAFTGTGTTSDGRRLGLIKVESKRAFGCAPSTYGIEPGNTLGSKGRVLAVHGDLVLLELQGKLHYLQPKGERAPTWQMVWRSGWSMQPYRVAAKGRATPSRSSSKRHIPKKNPSKLKR